MFWPNIFLELYQETIAAYIGTQWIEWLHSVDLVRAKKALTQRRHSQIYKRVPEWCATESAQDKVVVSRHINLLGFQHRPNVYIGNFSRPREIESGCHNFRHIFGLHK